MMRLAFVVLAGCAAAPAKPSARPAVGPAPKVSLQVRTWLEASEIGIDCPMSIGEARDLRSIADQREGDVAYVMGHVACLCDVSTRYRDVDFDPSCKLQPMPYHYAPRSRDEARLLAWHNALVDKVRSGATPVKLARSTPLAKQLRELNGVRTSARYRR